MKRTTKLNNDINDIETAFACCDNGLFEYVLILGLICVIVLFFIALNKPRVPDNPDYDKLVNAIYHAEGGEKASKPYGILSVPCDGHDECRRICFNTVRNQHRRWEKAGENGSYIDSLHNRYAPIGAGNDPDDLNENWKKNVTYYYFNPKAVKK